MAPTTRTRAAKPAEPVEPEEDFEEIEGDEDDLEEIEESDEDEAPVKSTKKAATKTGETKAPAKPKIEFGSPWLAAHVTETTGENFDARGIRMLLRKLAADGKLKREVGVTRERYEFSGPNDPIVRQVIALITSGEAKAMKQAGLQKVKDAAAAKKAAAKAAKEAAATEDEDDDEIEEAPAPKPRRTAAKAPAPAKATPATTRRRTAAAK